MQAGHGNLGTRSRLWSLFLIFPIAAVPTMIFYFWYGEWLHIVLICLLYLQLLCRSSEQADDTAPMMLREYTK